MSTFADRIDFPDSARLKSPEQVAYYAKATTDGHWDLLPAELWWRDRSELLEARGYQLRPRFRPGWKPSWLGNDRDPWRCEDSFRLMVTQIMDVTRLSDGQILAVKRVRNGANEVRIATLLSTPERLKEPRNHCVPILDHFQDTIDPEYQFLVMPLLRECDNPPFAFVGEVIDFMRQSLEGLEYLHEQNIAHRDIATGNIMMDGNALYPKGFHPTMYEKIPSTLEYAVPLHRQDVTGIRYYLIDFQLSTYFDDPSAPRLVTGAMAQTKYIPELSETKPYDPFPLDVYALGDMFCVMFLQTYSNFSFLSILMEKMIDPDPASRPSATEARKEFEDRVRNVKGYTLRWPLHSRDQNVFSHLMKACSAVAREAVYHASRILRRSR